MVASCELRVEGECSAQFFSNLQQTANNLQLFRLKLKIDKPSRCTGVGDDKEEHDGVEDGLEGRAGEFFGEMLAVFLEPSPGVIQHHGAAVEEEREDGWAG